jgi:hypothetical protein
MRLVVPLAVSGAFGSRYSHMHVPASALPFVPRVLSPGPRLLLRSGVKILSCSQVPQNPNTASDSAELVDLESRYSLLDGVIEGKKPPRAGRDAAKVGSGVERAMVTEGIDLGGWLTAFISDFLHYLIQFV